MSEYPIVMAAESIRAIQAGRKTQTRRVWRDAPVSMAWAGVTHDGWWAGHDADGHELCRVRCPYGRPGDLLWVRETWAFPHEHSTNYIVDKVPAIYRADGVIEADHWRSPRFMPRAASRITLKVVDVQLQRLQEISYQDVEAEGYNVVNRLPLMLPPGTDAVKIVEYIARETYREAWDALNARRGYPWASNPWVWVVSFTKI